MNLRLTFCWLLLCTHLSAGPRISSNFSIPTEDLDTSGQRSSSASYSNQGALGGIGSITTTPAQAAVNKSGYIAQLYEATALQLSTTQMTMNEGGQRQLTAEQLMDDLTVIRLPTNAVAWSVQSGPLSIDSSGLATSGNVFQDTAAVISASFANALGNLSLTVRDNQADNYGAYANDQLPDNWQVQYFGLNNPLAAPAQDPDGDGQSNQFEHTAGLDPADRSSLFQLSITPVPGHPNHRNLTFGPLSPDCTYTVLRSTSLLTGTWFPLTDPIITDNGAERTVTDTNAASAKKFYRVEISRP